MTSFRLPGIALVSLPIDWNTRIDLRRGQRDAAFDSGMENAPERKRHQSRSSSVWSDGHLGRKKATLFERRRRSEEQREEAEGILPTIPETETEFVLKPLRCEEKQDAIVIFSQKCFDHKNKMEFKMYRVARVADLPGKKIFDKRTSTTHMVPQGILCDGRQ
ncbi:hypothetical protein L596_008584 [Steinernema carpocapsae]|uniref:Uncharacterized protein n=1 Tax=Steinernema carpocapsae TaxID=34508 RepID=A0A4U5PD14_STECR|nr:hypothetical protein L596_008584 [Steinernema carpocapsae]